jgi:restriction system protein
MVDFLYDIPLPVLGTGLTLLALLARFSRPILRLLGWRKPAHRRRERQARRNLLKLAEIPEPGHKLAYLRRIDPFVFEEMILETFQQRGYKVKRNSRYTGDGGIDGRVWLDGELFLIQAKRYAGHISAAHVQEFCNLVASHGCKGFFIHTGKTGGSSRLLADSQNNVWIISGGKLLDLLDPSRRV